MAKIFCLLNNRETVNREKVAGSLNYHKSWQKKSYDGPDVSIGCFELPHKRDNEFWLENERFIFALDGEIFSWDGPISGKTTMEKVRALFEKEGPEAAKFMNGNFSLFVWDKQQKDLAVMNDRMGLRPVYYAHYHNKFCFSSEVKAIIADPDFQKKIDAAGMIDFLSYGHVFEDRTLFEGVKVFPYASTVRLNGKTQELNVRRYWDFRFNDDGLKEASEAEYLDQFKRVIGQAVERNIREKERVGISLSGGLDSRMITALADKRHAPIHTFTFSEKGTDEFKIARTVARKLGTAHHDVEIQHDRLGEFITRSVFYCDGLAAEHHYFVLSILEEVKRHVDILFDGYVGDSLSGRCNYYPAFQYQGEAGFFKCVDTFGEDLRREVLAPDWLREIDAGKQRFHSLFFDPSVRTDKNFWDYMNLTQRQRHNVLYGKVISRNALDVRLPFTDHDFMDFCLSMPRGLKDDQKLYKDILTRHYPEAGKIPLDGKLYRLVSSRLEKAVRWRMDALNKKFGLWKKKTIQCGRWFQTVLKDFTCSILLDQRCRDRKIFNAREVEDLLSRHFSGENDFEPQITILLMFEIGQRLFMDKEASL